MRRGQHRSALLGLGTATPGDGAPQQFFAAFLSNVARATLIDEQQERSIRLATAVCEKSGVSTRYSVVDDFKVADPSKFAFFGKCWTLDRLPTTRERMQWYERFVIDLSESAARRALDDAGVSVSEVTHLLFTTCTGFFAPGPDVRLLERLGLSVTVQRRIIGFMGCYATFNALENANAIVRADPEAVVLIVATELCSLHFQRAFDIETIVTNSLFSDGSGAAVVGSPGRARRLVSEIVATRSALVPNTLNQMSWTIGDHGFVMRLEERVPRALAEHARDFVRRLIEGTGVDLSAVGLWAIHPGGPRIVRETARALALSDVSLASTWSVLRDYGNMSSATILFVLERTRAREERADYSVALGFGPGLTMEGVLFLHREI